MSKNNYKANFRSVNNSSVEKAFIQHSGYGHLDTKIPCIIVDNFPKLGLITSLRFLEWVSENPEGVVSLPTGKTPEYFIKWTEYLLNTWNNKETKGIRKQYGLDIEKKPDLRGLHFVQLDEFYPISSKQHNSFYHYVMNYYINGFGLKKENALLINCDEIPLAGKKGFSEVFPDYSIDLSLRYRECRTSFEKLQQDSLFLIDNWCSNYEAQIREKGGIGFFLGGLGPDGHIAFNTRGTNLYSTTRLTETNFETQAVAASALGGIEVSSKRLVITVGLETITYNPNNIAIIIAAGEAKAQIVKQSLESEITNLYPATVLQRLKNSSFYITEGAASMLSCSIDKYYRENKWTYEKTEKAIIDLCKKSFKYGDHLSQDDITKDPYCKLIPGNKPGITKSVQDSIIEKINRGMHKEENQTFLHTGPHHDDIMLGILPFIANHIRNASNTFHFNILTSGFTAVTNQFVIDLLLDTKKFLDQNLIQMVNYPDFYKSGYQFKSDIDVYHYLNKVAAGAYIERRRGVCHRIARSLIEIYSIKNTGQLLDVIDKILYVLRKSYGGEKNPPQIQQLKGIIREFEEELVWAHYGIQVKKVHHLRLGFYKGDIFTEQPQKKRDVAPVLSMLKKIKPTVLSLTFDPEGSGPDTHYKALQAIAEAVRLWKKETNLSQLRIWGYRNVWHRFHPAEANIIFPVSLNGMSAMNEAFTNCYISQVDASFPSYELNGKFSDLAQKIWVAQLKDIQLLLGKNYFYQNNHPKIRATHGLIYIKEMTVDEFLNYARKLEESMEGLVK